MAKPWIFCQSNFLAVLSCRIDFYNKKLVLSFVFQGACVKKLSGKGKIEDNKATKQIVALLSAPLEKYNDIVTTLKLSNYSHVMEYLDGETIKVMAMVIVQSITKNKTQISTADNVHDPFCCLVFIIHYAF